MPMGKVAKACKNKTSHLMKINGVFEDEHKSSSGHSRDKMILYFNLI